MSADASSAAAAAAPGRLRLLRPPRPPYDDELAGDPPSAATVLALPTRPTAPTRVRREAVAAERLHPPVSSQVAGRIVALLLEVFAGLRPARQVATLALPGICEELARRAYRRSLSRRPAVPARVRSLHLSEPAPGVAEVCAVVQLDGRVAALAARLERRPTGWVCTALTLG